MKIIIVGVGKLGEYLAKSLVKDHHEVTLVDKDFYFALDVINNEDLNYICGNGLDPDVLIEAGIKDADLLISVMQEDENNIICCLLGKKLGAERTIARIRNNEYAKALKYFGEDLGLSMVINPDQLAADTISRVINIPRAIDATTFLKGRILMISIKVKEDSNLVNNSINVITKKFKGRIIICAIKRDGEIIVPTGATKILVGDKLYITGTLKDINGFLKDDNIISSKVRNVLICGGSRISSYLAKTLYDMGITVKIIEIDKEKCKELSEKLPEAIIVNGDASDQNVLFEEGLEDCDAFITLTGIDEENIIYSMFASNIKGCKRITKINHIDLDGIEELAGIDTVITPHKIATNHIAQYVMAMQNSLKSNCSAVYTFDNCDFEMLEFNVSNDFNGLNTKLRELKLKKGILIIAILRDKQVLFPSGTDEIRNNDIIVVIDSNNQIIELNDILD